MTWFCSVRRWCSPSKTLTSTDSKPGVAVRRPWEHTMTQDSLAANADGRTILDRFRLDGRTALVTGGGQGIGRAFCHALGEAGAQVVVAYMNSAKADEV